MSFKHLLAPLLCLNATAALSDPAITNLIQQINVIDGQLQLSMTLTTGAVGYATVGGVMEDGAISSAEITAAMLVAYQDAVQNVLAQDYATAQTAQELFLQEHAGAMNSLTAAVDMLSDATLVIQQAITVADIAAQADTKPEREALQAMLTTDEYTISGAEVVAYNTALTDVATYAQQAGAFMAAANNTELTQSIDQYAAANNFVVGTYTAITYTQNVDEFIITWDQSGFTSGWNGYLTQDMKSAQEVYDAGVYIETYGAM